MAKQVTDKQQENLNQPTSGVAYLIRGLSKQVVQAGSKLSDLLSKDELAYTLNGNKLAPNYVLKPGDSVVVTYKFGEKGCV